MSWRALCDDAAAALADRREARILIEEVAGVPYSRLFPELDAAPPAGARASLEGLVARRRAGEPLQHVVGHWPFRTLELVVDRRALVPRPETELVAGHALAQLVRVRALRPPGATLVAADLGTGSGAIACALVSEAEDLAVLAVDASADALRLAAVNRDRLGCQARARLELRAGDWYGGIDERWRHGIDCVVANPPYLAEREWGGLDPVVRDFDPYAALVAGPEGTEAIAAIVAGAPEFLAPHGALVVEIAPHQADVALGLARRAGFAVATVEEDLAGRPRALVARS